VEAELRKAGILVRSMAGKPLIDGALRVSLGTSEQMGRFWRSFCKVEQIDLRSDDQAIVTDRPENVG
jgi:histidinol-phosphate aminotransferase